MEVELDSVYEVNGQKVYDLQKTLTDELNKFHLNLVILLTDGRSRNLNTKTFQLLGKKKKEGYSFCFLFSCIF